MQVADHESASGISGLKFVFFNEIPQSTANRTSTGECHLWQIC